MRKKLLVLVLFLTTFSVMANNNKSYYQGLKWGTTIAQVKEKYTIAGESKRGSTTMLFDTQGKSPKIFIFNNGGLTQVSIVYSIKSRKIVKEHLIKNLGNSDNKYTIGNEVFLFWKLDDGGVILGTENSKKACKTTFCSPEAFKEIKNGIAAMAE